MTLLSILGTHSIALPLSPAFPAHELQYILDHSQAAMLLSSQKFEGKADEVLKEKLETPPKHVRLAKNMGGSEPGSCDIRRTRGWRGWNDALHIGDYKSAGMLSPGLHLTFEGG